MLACPSRTLEVMPYALAERTEDAGLCVCDLQVGRRAGGQGPGQGRAMLHERFTLFVLQNTAVTTHFYMGIPPSSCASKYLHRLEYNRPCFLLLERRFT